MPQILEIYYFKILDIFLKLKLELVNSYISKIEKFSLSNDIIKKIKVNQ